MKNSLDAFAKIFSSSAGIPTGGLSSQQLRVELTWSECNWIAEISFSGEMPWILDEFCSVNLRIMSEKFREYVERERPKLDITRGGNLIGEIIFDLTEI